MQMNQAPAASQPGSNQEKRSGASLWIGITVVALVILGGLLVFASNDEKPDTDVEDAEVEIITDEEMNNALDAGTTLSDDPATSGIVDDTEDNNSTTIQITGENFKFSEEEIRVKQGDTVRIVFESTEGFHDWVVDEFDAATEQVRPGTPTEVSFVADQTGTFEYYCSVGNHRAQGMVGNLIVE